MERKVKMTERGWPGHFVAADKCYFRRNTLLECGDDKIVVSTVGNYRLNGVIETIGTGGRYYETMAFNAVKDGCYLDADILSILSINNKSAICANSKDELPDDVDNIADMQHEAVVGEFIDKLENKFIKK